MPQGVGHDGDATMAIATNELHETRHSPHCWDKFKVLYGVYLLFHRPKLITHVQSPREGLRSYAISSDERTFSDKILQVALPLHVTTACKARRRQTPARFRISLSLSRWEIRVSGRLFARFWRSLFAEQRWHSRSCYEPRARDQARKKTITFFAWKQAASQILFTISN